MSKYEVKRAFFNGRTYHQGELVDEIPKGFESFFSDEVEEVETTSETTSQENEANETNDDEVKIPTERNSVDEIKDFAVENGIDLGDAKTKKEMIEIITSALDETNDDDE